MPMVTVKFEVTPSSGVTTYTLSVGRRPVPLSNGKGSIRLAKSSKHYLLWWFQGTEGSKISIKGTQAGDTVVEVKNSRIPPGEDEGAGAKRFSL